MMISIRTFCTAASFATLFFSCTKSEPDVDPVISSPPLFAASTGWEKVGSVKYTYTTVGYAGKNSMQPIELMQGPDQMQILYTENYALFGTDGRVLYKGLFTPGANDTVVTTKLNLAVGGDETKYQGKSTPCFIPGTFTAMLYRYFSNPSPYSYLGIHDENNTVLSSHFIGHPNRRPKVYPNGDVLDGTFDYSNYAELDYYNRASNSWTYIKGTSHDTTTLTGYTPFKLANDSLYAFNITTKGEKMYLSIAVPSGEVYPKPLYRSLFLQEIPDFHVVFGTQYPSIVVSVEEGNTFTVVLGMYPEAENTINKLHAFSWTAGSSSFTSIYSNIPIDEITALYLGKPEVRCRPDGMAYVWVAQPDGLSGALHTINGEGLQQRGKVTYDGKVLIGAVRSLNGSFYGVAYPTSDLYDTEHHLRMDIIRLK